MSVQQLSDGNPDGATLGQSSTDLVGFHGADPLAQVSLTTLASSATAATTAASVVEIIALLRNKGLAG